MDSLADYPYKSTDASESIRYLWIPVRRLIEQTGHNRVFEIGCGNGATACRLSAIGCEVTGVDTSESGVSLARTGCPAGRFEIASAYDNLTRKFGRFPIVLSLEVVEHCFYPRKFARTAFDLLEPGGTAIISTPFHGYWKNLALALTGKMDGHFTALWDGGHIKFWSERTLRRLLEEAGFTEVRFLRAGRVGPIAKSMIAVAHRPPD